MTEDDTFRILRRTPHREMEVLLKKFYWEKALLEYHEWIEFKVEFLKTHGWTLYELNKFNADW